MMKTTHHRLFRVETKRKAGSSDDDDDNNAFVALTDATADKPKSPNKKTRYFFKLVCLRGQR